MMSVPEPLIEVTKTGREVGEIPPPPPGREPPLTARVRTDRREARCPSPGEILDSHTLDLPAMIDDLEATFRGLAGDKGLELVVSRSPDLPRRIVADPVELRQSIAQLLGNAVRYTRHGRVILRVRSRGETLSIEVEDTGPGIAPGELARLFGSLEQGSSGLAVPYAYARRMTGELRVASTVGRGSTFRLDLPLEVPASRDAGRV